MTSMQPDRSRLQWLFDPTSIAVVGASTSPAKLGSVMLDAVARSSGDTRTVFGINAKATDGSFLPSLRAATEVHGHALDLAVLCVPAAATADAVRDAAECGVGAAVICSGGFAEAGVDGEALQAQLAAISSTTGIRLLGPNTSGFFRPNGVTVSFVPTVEHIAAGHVAVVAASGGMNHALSFLLSESGVGVGLGVGLGNCVDVTNTDVLRFLRDDPTITAIALHIETVDDGEALLSAVRTVSADKPIVATVTGRSDVSAFSESHTGALATSWRTTCALLTEAGAVVVDSDQQLVDALRVLSRTRLPASPIPGIGLITAQAGPGLAVLDQLLAHGVRVPPLAKHIQAQLSKLLPPMTFQANPVDTGRPGPTFADVLSVTATDAGIDALAVYALAEPDVIDLADTVRQSGVHHQVPVVLATGGPAEAIEKATAAAAEIGVPVVPSPSALATGIQALVQDARTRHLHEAHDAAGIADSAPEIQLPADEAAAKDLLDSLGITTPRRRVCADHAAAYRALTELPLPVAVKILDATVVHKTEVGGVHLGVSTADDLQAALDALDAIAAPAYLIESMAGPGVDLFLGARRDPVFGPILVAGLGGTAAEAIGDVAIRSCRLGDAAAAAMLDDLQCAPLLDGWRGGPALDRDVFARISVTLARYLTNHAEIVDIEINPLRLTSTGLIALDAVILAADNQPSALKGELP
jgi:acyl-CoA synthetase (NDP forming)